MQLTARASYIWSAGRFDLRHCAQMKRILPILLLTSAAQASHTPATQSRPDTGRMPVLSAAEIRNLKGPDANRNGVRDDLDRKITQLFSTTRSRQAATLYMAASSRSMENNTSASVLNIQKAKDNYLSCLAEEHPADWDTKVSLLMATLKNTEARFKRYQAFEQLLAGEFTDTGRCPLPRR